MRSESSENVWKTTGFFTHFSEHPQEVWEILKAFPEQLKESDQLRSVDENGGPVPEITLEYDVNGGYLPEDLVVAARLEDIDWVHSEGVYEFGPMKECKDAGMKPLDLIWVDTDKSVDPACK